MTDTCFLKGASGKKVSEDEKASGTSPEPSEEDVMMEEIVSLFDEADRLNDSKRRKCKKKLLKQKKCEI